MAFQSKAGFFNKALLGSTILRDNIFEAVRDVSKDVAGKIIGECVVDSSNAGLGITASADTLNDRRLTVTGALPCLDDAGSVHPEAGSGSDLVQLIEGSRTITLHDPTWYSSLPYRNQSGQTYRVYLTRTEFPIDVGIATDGSRGYSRWIEAPGIEVKPNSVVDAGTYLELRLTASLTALGHGEWLTTNSDNVNWSYDCVVYLDTDQASVAIAVDDPDVAIAFAAKLVKRAAGGWMVKLDGIGDGYLGQASPSLTAAHYNIVILGPHVTTTDHDSDPEYVHVGTVLSGASETVDTTQQRIVNSVSQALVDASTVPDALLVPGWVTRPTVTFGATSITFGTGEVFVNGSMHDTAGQVLGSLTAASTLYVYWDDATDAYAFSTLFSDAVSVGRVPIARVETDGGSNITLGHVIGRMVALFNDLGTHLTVSNSTEHNPMFTTIKEALAYAAARNTIAAGDPGWTIELIGTALVTETISDADLLGVPGVTFTSRVGHKAGAGSTAHAGRINWSMDDPLFTVPSGTTLRNWRFVGINFQYAGTGTAADTAVINNQGDIVGLQFEGCLFNGNDVLSGPSVYLPHIIYSTAGTITDLEFRNCTLNSAEAAIWVTAAANGCVGLKVIDCKGENDSTATVLSQAGFITDLGTASGEPTEWVLRGNRFKNGQGHGINAWALKDSWITDNYIAVETDHCCISVGNTTTRSDTSRLVVRDNICRQDGGSTNPVVRVRTQDASTADRARVLLHDNIIDATDTPVGSVGVQIDATDAHGVVVHDNLISQVETGLSSVNAQRGIFHDNMIHASLAGMYVETGGTVNSTVIGHNMIVVDAEDAIGLEVDFGNNEVQASIVAGNLIDFQDATSSSIGFKADDTNELNNCSIIGNIFRGENSGCVSLQIEDARSCTITGNLMVKGHTELNDSLYVTFVGNVNVDQGDMLFNTTASNVVVAANISSTDLMVRDGNDSVAALNIVGQELEFGQSTGGVFGNRIGVDLDLDFNDGSACIIVGNEIGGVIDEDATTDNCVVVGNRVQGNSNLDQAQGTWAGNRFVGDVTLTAGVTGGLFVGNQVDGTFTNNSTGSTVANNEN